MLIQTIALHLAVAATLPPLQETRREVDGPGVFSKYLTPGTVDRWVFDTKAGETIIAIVQTFEFDPTLELVVGPEASERSLRSVDDDGGTSRFSIRVLEDGEHRIRVRGFEDRGGGNYTLELQRFTAEPLSMDAPTVGTFDADGRAYHYFEAPEDQWAVVDVPQAKSWRVLDPKGQMIPAWGHAVHHEQPGEAILALEGKRGARYEAHIRSAVQRPLSTGQVAEQSLSAMTMAVHGFEVTEGDFRVIEVQRGVSSMTRLVHDPLERLLPGRTRVGGSQAMTFLPIVSKGGVDRYAVRFDKSDRFQVQVLSYEATDTTLSMLDPTQPLSAGAAIEQSLGLGQTAFFGFEASPGQSVELTLTSEAFDPYMWVFGGKGQAIAENDDGGGGLASRISHTSYKGEPLRIFVSSVGGGGGGPFRLQLNETPPTAWSLGERAEGTLAHQGSDLWSFDATEGQVLIFTVRPDGFDSQLTVRDSNGVVIGEDDNDGLDKGCLLTLVVPRSGQFTAQVRSKSGSGSYVLNSFLDR